MVPPFDNSQSHFSVEFVLKMISRVFELNDNAVNLSYYYNVCGSGL